MGLHNQIKFVKKKSILLLVIFSYHGLSFAEKEKIEELKYADKQLNVHYQRIISRLRPYERPKLRKAQNQWILFRDLDCGWAFKQEPAVCLLERTKARTRDFEEDSYYYARSRS